MSPPPPFSVTLIGTGAVRAHPTRGGASFLVRLGDQRWLFDCGRLAVHNLNRFGTTVDQLDRVFITHLHFDHLTDLPLVILLSWVHGRTRPLPVHGPTGIGDFLEHGVRKAYAEDIRSRLAHGKDPRGLEWETHEIAGEGVILDHPDCRIDTLRTEHAGLLNFSYRLRSGDRTVIIGSDSSPDPRWVDFARDADLMLVECSGTREFYDSQAWGHWHMSPEEIGAMARDAGIRQLVLKHLVIENFSPDPNISESMARTIRNLHPQGQITVGEDGMSFDL